MTYPPRGGLTSRRILPAARDVKGYRNTYLLTEVTPMAINLVEAVMNNLKGPILEQVSGWIGESPEKTKAATEGFVPAIMSALADKVSGADG